MDMCKLFQTPRKWVKVTAYNPENSLHEKMLLSEMLHETVTEILFLRHAAAGRGGSEMILSVIE